MNLTAVLFVLLFSSGCIAALARHPIYGVVTYVLVFYVSPSDRWWGQGFTQGVRWALIAAGIVAISLLIHRPRQPAIPLARQPLIWGFVAFVAWVGLQSIWAINPEMHLDLLGYYAKYIIAMYLIYRSIDSEENLRRFMWAHVLGCVYLSWIAYTGLDGGRFDSFGGSGIGDANSGALTIVTGILVATSLFLASTGKLKAVIVVSMPLLLNAIVATISRSGFLALGVAGLVYNLFAPLRQARWIRIMSLAGLALFLLLTNPVYWERMQSLEYQGQQVEGVDTGSKRLVLAQAQWQMFRGHPWGCGSRCTDALSPKYLDQRQLSEGSRSSHNTFMTMLVDHGWPGALAYLAMTAWMLVTLRRLRKQLRGSDDFLAKILPAVAGSLIAITVGDLFVQYPKLEVRFWLLTVVMSMVSMASVRSAALTGNAEATAAPATGAPGVRAA